MREAIEKKICTCLLSPKPHCSLAIHLQNFLINPFWLRIPLLTLASDNARDKSLKHLLRQGKPFSLHKHKHFITNFCHKTESFSLLTDRSCLLPPTKSNIFTPHAQIFSAYTGNVTARMKFAFENLAQHRSHGLLKPG